MIYRQASYGVRRGDFGGRGMYFASREGRVAFHELGGEMSQTGVAPIDAHHRKFAADAKTANRRAAPSVAEA